MFKKYIYFEERNVFFLNIVTYSGTVDPIMMSEVFFPTSCKRDFFRIVLYRRDRNVFDKNILSCVPEWEGKANVIKSAKRMLFSLALSLLTSAQHCIFFLLSLQCI